MRNHFHLFVYGTLTQAGAAARMLHGATQVTTATAAGTLYDIDGAFPALVLAGNSQVEGEVWRCPSELLRDLDAYEDVAGGLFRRVAVRAAGVTCWVYVAGPALARKLVPARRV